MCFYYNHRSYKACAEYNITRCGNAPSVSVGKESLILPSSLDPPSIGNVLFLEIIYYLKPCIYRANGLQGGLFPLD